MAAITIDICYFEFLNITQLKSVPIMRVIFIVVGSAQRRTSMLCGLWNCVKVDIK